jgi:DNA-binding YbaB/EbfC family protein
MFGNLGDINLSDLEKTVSSMQEQAKKVEEENEKKLFHGKSGGGMVEVVMNGKGEAVDVIIDPSLAEDLDSLQILLVAGFNEANNLVKENQKSNAMNMVNQLNPFQK